MTTPESLTIVECLTVMLSDVAAGARARAAAARSLRVAGATRRPRHD